MKRLWIWVIGITMIVGAEAWMLTHFSNRGEAPTTFTLVPVHDPNDARTCGQAHGLAAIVAPLDESGGVSGSFAPACLVPVK